MSNSLVLASRWYGQHSRYVECVNLKKILWEEKTITNVHTHTCIKERERESVCVCVCVCVCISSLHNRVKAIEYTST